MGRSKSSQMWLKEHVNDVYVQQAKKAGYRTRAAYKLLEIHEKDRLISPGAIVADLGSAPGSWSQVVRRLVGDAGKVFAIDILHMEPIEGVEFIQGDFREQAVLDTLVQRLRGQPLDLVISDMAPNMTGMRTMDQANSFYLAELALEFARDQLKPTGHFLVKVFQGSEFCSYLETMRGLFQHVVSRKPLASRDRSNEIYLLGKRRR